MPRRRWKRWAALAFVLMIGYAVWTMSGESETIRRSRAVRLSMTMAEVQDIMGDPLTTLQVASAPGASVRVPSLEYATQSEFYLYCFKRDIWHGMRSIGQWESKPSPLLPVEVRFDETGQVALIRRGTTIETP